MNDWTEARVRDLIVQLANLPQVTAAPYLLGAKAGQLMRQLDPTFHAAVLGDRRLKELLARFPDLVEVGPASDNTLDVVIRFPGKTDSGRGVTIEPIMWQALVAPRRGQLWYLDLASGEPVAVDADEAGQPRPGTGPRDEGHRYLEIPRVDQDGLRATLREWVQQTVVGSSQPALLEALDAEDWFPAFRDAGEASGVQGWKGVHRRAVADHFRQWAARHGIKPARYLRDQGPPAVGGPSRHRTDEGLRRSRVRSIVEQAIARMSDEELLELKIPLRYVLD